MSQEEWNDRAESKAYRMAQWDVQGKQTVSKYNKSPDPKSFVLNTIAVVLVVGVMIGVAILFARMLG